MQITWLARSAESLSPVQSEGRSNQSAKIRPSALQRISITSGSLSRPATVAAIAVSSMRITRTAEALRGAPLSRSMRESALAPGAPVIVRLLSYGVQRSADGIRVHRTGADYIAKE